MKRTLFLFLFWLSCSFVYSQGQRYVFGSAMYYPPYEFINDEGEIDGFNIDLLKAIAVAHNIEFDFYSGNWETVRSKLESRELDGLSGMFYSGERSEKYHFSIPHSINVYNVFYRNDSEIESLDELKDKTIIVENGDIVIQYLKTNFPELKLVFVNNHKDALLLLSSGKHDGAFLSQASAHYLINYLSISNLEESKGAFLFFNYCFAATKSSRDLVDILNDGLTTIKENGEYDSIYNKWFGDNKNKHNWLKIGLIVNSFLIVFLIVILIYTYVLKRKLSSRSKQLSHQLTQRKEIEDALRQSESRLRQIIDLVPHMIYAKDIHGNYIMANKAVADKYKTVAENLVGRNQREFHDDYEEINRMLAVDEGVILENKPKILPNDSFTDKNGKKIILHTIKLPFKDTGLNEPVVLGISMDITEKYQNEQIIIHERALFSSIINSLPDIIFYKDLNGVYLGGNHAFIKFLGPKALHFVGKNDFELFPTETAKSYFEVDQQVLKTKKPWTEKVWDNLPDGQRIYLQNIKVPFVDNEGKILGLVGICHDITDRYNAEKALSVAKEKAEESDRLKSSFLANMSHEIRTPMNAIIGFTDLLGDPDLTADQKDEFIGLIHTSGNTLLTLLDDIIDITKIESGQLRLTPTECQVNMLLRELQISFNELLKRYDKTNISLYFKEAVSDLKFSIVADALRIKQVLSNLIGNAIKFTDTGYVEFGYRLTDNGFIEFYVKDTGIGVAVESTDMIFDRFGQVNNSFITHYGGSGLGLTISKNLVELMGGKIWMESELEKGSTFYFTVPYLKTGKQAGEIIPLQDQGYSNVTETADFSDYLILIAEDEETNYMFLSETLKRTKVKLLWAHNGLEAVDFVKSNPEIDLVLMDLKMPGMNGYEATRMIRIMMPELPIIAQTAYAMSDEKEKSVEAGCNEYLTKPIKPSMLIYTIKKFLKSSEQ